MFSFFSSGGGIPGMTSDGQVPGGAIVAGGITVGDVLAALAPTFSTFYGNTSFYDSPANSIDGDQNIFIRQREQLNGDVQPGALEIMRSGALNGHDYVDAAFTVRDLTASTQPVARFNKSGADQFTVDGDGIKIHGKLKTGASVAHSLGSYSGNSVPIYNESGTLLGYMPLYA